LAHQWRNGAEFEKRAGKMSRTMDEKALKTIVDNRIQIAKRWFGIKDRDAAARFILDDPAMNTPEANAALLRYAINVFPFEELFDATPDKLVELRSRFSSKFVDAMLKIAEDYKRDCGGDPPDAG
jgi:hypothetical protein